MNNNFRVILAKQRKKVSDVHKATGISKSTLTALYYERSKNPTFETLQKVADFLEVTIDDLLKVG
ncbi:helix-turn-helix domain-containing protein [Streptococcus pseudopneumoniae]|uniref:XRE family transcriptional regulator n=1 Tax=Streptococcus pseudopneumoniae TaxID=257758 RepID=A0A3A4RYR2_9STRE|nr:helix-turn-helix transcriptional regulator [Streptococcus pseudopneumoniae]RJP82105.1 XRE family transcriptional regulator [Streptococcus pseudopneumoniae]